MIRAVIPIAALAATLLAGCAQTQWRNGGANSAALLTPDQTMDLEVTDRVARFARLADQGGTLAPEITQTVVPASAVTGATRPIPVLRVVFDARDFFDPGSDVARPEAARVIRLMAENMRRDVPDARLTLLGHSDAEGGEAANIALSRRRALGVMRILVADGVAPGQLSTVAIGPSQPIAPNATSAGRARNRRVEFLISASETANLAVVSRRPINPAFLALGAATGSDARVARRAAVFRPSYAGPADVSEAPGADRSGGLTLVSAGPDLALGQNDDPADTGSPVTSPSATSQTPSF